MCLWTRVIAGLAILPALYLASSAGAHDKDEFPLRPIRLIIGAPPCGEMDTLARLVGEYVGQDLGQPVIVDYKPGAANNLAAEAVARSEPDGYTLFLGGRANITHRTMYPWIKYDYASDLTPLGLVGTAPPILVAGLHTPITGVHDLVRIAKERPGELSCGSVGVGTSAHLMCEILKESLEIDLRHVPLQGSAAALTAMIGGRIDMQVTVPSAALPYISAGKVRPLAMLGTARLATLPEVPTLIEAGVAAGDYRIWYGLLAPTGTPTRVVTRLNQALNAALKNPKLIESMARNGVDPATPPNSPSDFQNLIVSETKLWTGVLRKRRIPPADPQEVREEGVDLGGSTVRNFWP